MEVFELGNWIVGPFLKKEDRTVFVSYRGITFLILPEKVYARALERQLHPVVETRIQEQLHFCTICETVEQLFNIAQLSKGVIGGC